jgi:opacity protein-like surface antigen
MTRRHSGRRTTGWRAALIATALTIGVSAPATAQEQGFMIRGFGDIGATTFTAEQSFEAVLGSGSGKVFGGGVEVVMPFNVFASVRASRFRETGHRVFLFEGQRFDLGIPTTISVTPVELTGGLRVPVATRLAAYGGGGVGWYSFRESSEFAGEDENVDDTFTGYHVLGGAEVSLVRWLAVAGELQWATVPDAIGSDRNSVSHEFNESNLGGTTFRFKVIVGM